MAAGAAVASANTAAATSSAYNAGVAAGSANTAAATGAAYSAGVAAGAAAVTAPPGAVPASGTWVMGMAYASLPSGALQINKDGTTYYLSGNTWFKPTYGANGVFYTVVPTP